MTETVRKQAKRPMGEPTGQPTRPALTRDLVLEAAVTLADHEGLAALSMRRLGQELGVEAMSLYHHVANKEALLDGMVDAVVTELNDEVGPGGGADAERDWSAALRSRFLAARTVMLRHQWLPSVIESRTQVSPPLIAYFEGVLATLVAGGFSYDLAHHTLHALGSRALGFSQELFDPGKGGDAANVSEAEMAAMAAAFPHLGAMMADIAHEGSDTTLGWCDDQAEFEFGLDVLLDGLERARRHHQAAGHTYSRSSGTPGNSGP
jgi:AcrR family transcriptional regulator